VDFTIESMETEPQLLHLLAPNEAVVSIGVEVRIGESVGMMNIAMPSIVIKMMRQKFDQQWSVRKTHANSTEQVRVLKMLREGSLSLEARLEGPTLKIADLLRLSEGHLIKFDYPVERPVELLVNGNPQIQGADGEHRSKTGLSGGVGAHRALSGQEQRRRSGNLGRHFQRVEVEKRVEEGATALPAIVVGEFEVL